MKTYTGIGSRKTPESVLEEMLDIAAVLGANGWTLRSGCAPGADTAFEKGAWIAHEITDGPRPELYLPWAGFGDRYPDRVTLEEPAREAYPIAQQFHPRWSALTKSGQRFHARNVHQVYGRDVLEPAFSRFIVCWTKDAKSGGGTGQAIRIAKASGIPVFDLADPSDNSREYIEKLLQKGE